MKYTTLIAVTMVSVGVAILHLTIPTRTTLSWPGTYEAFAHIWIGVLVTGYCFTVKQPWFNSTVRNPFWWSFWALTLFEVFVVIKGNK